MSEEIELVAGGDGVLHMKVPKPAICISFESDDALIAWTSDMSNKSLFPDNTKFEFQNIENEIEFLKNSIRKLSVMKKERDLMQPKKNPGMAAVASFFFAGLGQIYNGEIWKGVLLMVIQVINVLLFFVLLGFVTYPITWIYGIWDAYKTAEAFNKDIEE